MHPYLIDDSDSPITEKMLFKRNRSFSPSSKYNGLDALVFALLFLEAIDRIGPKLRYDLNHRLSKVDNSGMGAVVDRKFKRLRMN